MRELHTAYLSLGSNIQPDLNLVKAIRMLQQRGKIDKISSAWESESVGAEGPNYLNACVRFISPWKQTELKEQILLSIETELGRKKSDNRYAPRTMDIDIVVFDEESCDNRYWEQAFVIIPLAEIHPEFKNPLTGEPIHETATRLRSKMWMEARRDVLAQFNGGTSAA